MFIKERQGFKFPFQSNKNEIPLANIASNQSTVDLVSDQEKDGYFFRALEKEKIFLNENQLEAVRSMEGAYLVIAGAGSGKTRVLTSRTAYLLTFGENVMPEQIMLVTFTRKAATEMLERMQRLPGISHSIANRIVSGTFHSIFLKLLRSRGYNHKILASEKYKEIMVKNILRDQGLKDSYEPETILSAISHYKSLMLQPNQVDAKTPVEKEIKEVYMEFEERKEKGSFMDFDDILLHAYYLLKNDDVLREQLRNRFRYILIDEYQDCNLIQHELIKLLANSSNNLFAVGDPQQSIYGFRNSSIDYILNLHEQYESLKILNLDTNYRSNNSIVGLGNALIKHNKKRLGNPLRSVKNNEITPLYMRPDDSDDEAKMIVDNIVAEVKSGNRNYKEFAVLYRTHSLSRAIWDQLVWRKIPFVTHGNNSLFYENSLVKPILDHLRLSLDSNDLDAISGIAPSLFLNREKVIDHIQSSKLFNSDNNKSFLAILMTLKDLKSYHRGQILNRIEYIRGLRNKSPLEAIRLIRKGPIKYDEYLDMDDRKTFSLAKEVIDETLDELEASASKFTTIEEYIGFIKNLIQKHKEMEEIRKDQNADAVQLLTLHSSKGLEFKCVFLIGFIEGVLPHKSAEGADKQSDRIPSDKNIVEEAIDEERRLGYVGITRAEEELYISSPKKYRGKDAEISRFLKEAFLNTTKK